MFQADVQLVDREQAEHVDAALQTMKESLQVLREPSQVALMIMMINFMTQESETKACQSIKAVLKTLTLNAWVAKLESRRKKSVGRVSLIASDIRNVNVKSGQCFLLIASDIRNVNDDQQKRWQTSSAIFGWLV